LPDDVIIDGSEGEGGGQILRTGLAFSAITGKGLTIKNIRANRPKPGMAHQHLAGLKAIREICGAEVEGAEIGCTEVRFSPGTITHGEYGFEVGTAGSVTLVLQTLLPALASTKGESIIIISGGTDVKWSPPADYYRLVLFPMLCRMGLECSIDIKKRGYYPRGGGSVEARVRSPGALRPLRVGGDGEAGEISGIVNITALPVHIAERIERTIGSKLPDELSSKLDIVIDHRGKGPSQGVGVVLAATKGDGLLGGSALGERGKPAEKVGKEAIENLTCELNIGAGVDIHAADQILPYMALGPAGSLYNARTLSNHAMTNISVIEKFLGKTFEVDGSGVRRT
jgi:RNA 3'-phosphate cyclase